MRLILRGGCWALGAALALTVWFGYSAGQGTVTVVWCLALVAAFAMALLLISLPAAAIGAWTSRHRNVNERRRSVDAWALAGLICVLFFARLEPAHQLFGPTQHIGLMGILDLILLALAATAIVYGVSGGGPRRRWRYRAGTVALTALCLEVAAVAQDPAADRSAEVKSYPATDADGEPSTSGPSRLLFIGIDGLDWRLLTELSRQHQLPGLQKLITQGRRWSLDTAGLKRSPEAWSSIHKGTPPRTHGIGGFSRWLLFSGMAVVHAQPYFGPHLPFFIDHFMAVLPAAFWDHRLTTAAHLARPAFWEIAADARVPTAVVSPFPFTSPLFAVEGAMAALDPDAEHWFVGTTTDGRSTITSVPLSDFDPLPSDMDADIWLMHSERVAMAERLFSDVQPRLGVFYTSAIDETMHDEWRRDCGSVGVCALELDQVHVSAIADAYRRVDRDIERLITAFGTPATVVLVSDHGWELGEAAHVFGPDGVWVVSPADRPGFAGCTDIYRVAPTLLSALGLPAESDMTPLTADGQPLRRASPRLVTRTQLLDAAGPSADRLELLRAVG